MISDSEAIARQRLFAGLGTDDLAAIAACAHHEVFPAGSVLFREGQRADKFFVLMGGRVALSSHLPDRGAVVLETLGAGDVVGWSWLFRPREWHFDAAALDDVESVVIDAPKLLAACEAEPRLGWELLQRFGEVMHRRLQATRMRLLDLYGGAGGDS